MKTSLKRIYLALILILMYAPIVTLVVLSFNNSRTSAKWGGFTTKWYTSLFQSTDIMNALYTTLTIALLSALIATIIGTAGAIGIQALGRKMKAFMMAVTNIPMLNADIVTGISLMLLFIAFRFSMGFSTVLLAHITFNIPYVILSVLPKLKQLDNSTYEAALDLGASPAHAFFKVIFPDILPGIFSGFLLAFTMSLDDFIITHFTKGPGVDTLSTKIYGESRKGIKPEMYALSTLLFLTVLLLLILINTSPEKNKTAAGKLAASKRKRISGIIFRRVIPACLVTVISLGGIYYGAKSSIHSDNQVIVYNFGEYLDPEAIEMFEKDTGISVVYEEYESNEIMYPKIQSGAISYDVVCPSDYMVQRMIENDMLAELDYDKIPNIKYIDQEYLDHASEFDPGNRYSVPHLWGTVGILYNTSMVNEPVDSWGILWDEKYADSILMQDSVRDTLGITLKYLGYSMNTTDLDELEAAKTLLIEQKPLVQAYVGDQVRDKMIAGEAALGVIYSGEALFCQMENPDLEYVIPKEGSMLWIDSWVIPKNARHKENAEAFINYMCRPEIAKMNFDYITYSIPNSAGQALIEEKEFRESKIAFPDLDTLTDCESLQYLGESGDALYNKLWREIKSK